MNTLLLAAVLSANFQPTGVYVQVQVRPAKYQPTGVFAQQPLATGEAAHTPLIEVSRVIQLLPKPQIAFVDYGCGYDARWCVAAAEHWKGTVKVIGVELDPARARAARERIRALGLGHVVTIIEGDATTAQVDADVGVAYLYPETLVKLRPRLERLRAFASYLHQVPGVQMTKNGDTWVWTQTVAAAHPQVVWNGRAYSGPVCNNPNCAMCNSIRAQQAAATGKISVSTAACGHYETRVQAVKVCNGRQCWYENRQVQVWVPNS